MPSLVYAPGIKVYVDTYKHGILDVSDDITDFSMTRRSDGVSTFNFNLQNTRRKYDNVFTPNDRIVVMMKRLVWMRTYTGYLNGVPLFTAWPRVVPLTSSCSLKRLQYFYWDSTLAASETLVRNALQAKTAFGQPDGGIKNVVLELLDKVVGWNGPKGSRAEGGGKVHIGNIPDNWYQFAVEIAKGVQDGLLESQSLAAEMRNQLGGGSTMYGQNGSGTSLIPPGTYGHDYDAVQVKNATTIILVGRRMGATEKDLVVAIATAIVECDLRNLASRRVPGSEKQPGIDGISKGDFDSVGLFQQRDNGAWTEGKDPVGAQRLNPEHAATAFFKVLLRIGNRDKTPVGVLAQHVQASAFPDRYGKVESDAAKIVQASTIPTAGTARSGFRPGDTTLDASTTRTGNARSGRGLVETSIEVTQRLRIPYRLGNDSGYTDPDPKVLDCSSFVQWAYYHSVGSIGGLPRSAHEQAAWCLAAGGKQVSVATGMNTSGALMFMGGTIPGIHHVEISMGNGRQTVGAHHTGTTAGIVNAGASAWDYAMLLPGIDYSASAIDGGAPVATYDPNSKDPRKNGDLPPRPNSQAYNSTGGPAATGLDGVASTDPIDALFGTTPWADTTTDGAGNALDGLVALSNDEPILPYIKNLMNSTLRAFSSAPNGDFIAWFPDYYGLWGTAAVMQLEPIEVVDFTVNWSDDYFVTHQFVTASNPGVGLNLKEGTITSNGGFNPLQTTHGIASIDEPAIMKALFGYDRTPEATREFTYFIYQRFGARPNWTEQPGIVGPKAEFFYALFLFMRQWAFQYDANIDLTFMPELWPGMLIQMPFFNFQAYVTTVTHSGQFGAGGGFTTQINIASPARLSDKDSRLTGLPLAGKYDAGRITTDPFADRAAVAKLAQAGVAAKLDRMDR